MSTEPTFLEHVTELGRPLCERYALEVVEDSAEFIHLRGEVLTLRIFSGWPKDPYPVFSVAYSEAEHLGRHASFEMWRYVGFREAWSCFPVTWPQGANTKVTTRNRTYSYVASPFILLEHFTFLAASCDALFQPDTEHLQGLVAWIEEQDRLYNERVTRKR